jgi:hypothetical protein
LRVKIEYYFNEILKDITVRKTHLGLALILVQCFAGCIRLVSEGNSPAVLNRPAYLESYYNKKDSYKSFTNHRVQPARHYTVRRILLKTDTSEFSLDYYQIRGATSKELILVFPVLGGKPIIENYLADYLARKGYETAIIHRNDEFKDPNYFDNLEEIFRNNIVKDRIALDFFEKEYGKKVFGGIGMSRGAINLATLAGIDKRLKYNVYILGATDLASVFKDTDQGRIESYVRKVTAIKGINNDKFKDLFHRKIITEPSSYARYLDPKNSLLFLALFDKTVPFKHGVRLRKQIGNPETIFLFAEHFTTVAYTRILNLMPFDYIEGETVRFFDKSFGRPKRWWHLLGVRIVQAPLNWVAQGLVSIWDKKIQKIEMPPEIVDARLR